MASPRQSDQTLLGRLNALKSSNITPEKASNVPIASVAADGEASVSREDALAARLRTLRDQIKDKEDSPSPPPPQPSRAATAQPQWETNSKQKVISPTVPIASWAALDDDPYAYDEADMQELLEDLASADFLNDEEEQIEFSHAPGSGSTEETREATSDDLLETLQKHSNPTAAWRGTDAKVSRDDIKGGSDGHPSESDSDDSDGEPMTRHVEAILSQAQDEISLGATAGAEDVDAKKPIADDHRAEASPTKGGIDLGTSKDTETNSNNGDIDDLLAAALSLPAVPSSEPSPPAAAGSHYAGDGGDGFEDDILRRMASLKGLGTASMKTDSYGLPSVPTFQPKDRPKEAKKTKKAGYTAEDEKTWCIVCLEDATVQCIGCDDDVYCGKCWNDMHLGPAAGYEERSHKWAGFERTR
ncbi:hypothetical protein B0H63DRAFT_22960 [Podospora didyma]|uniref:Abscission/NoCut checkpoint regulator n=1 Tax=Podospora didyma TaxID=330526 RepID=A0AAE0P5G7_9PEZI|nr:hypothetical protein B0H63DRAFT_22960 [Podospora didyma]